MFVCLAALMSLWLSGCTGEQDDPEFPVSRFDVWKIPSSGRSLPAPRGLYADEEDNVYVLDNAGRVLVYDARGSLKAQWEMPQHDVGKPEGILRMHDGRIAVADTHYHRVVMFDADGNVSTMFGTQGSAPGEFVFPVSIAQDPQGFLYVGEYGDRQRIQKFTLDGTFVTEFGEHGTNEGQFQRPSGLAIHNGEILVVDAFNNRIQVFDSDGHFLRVISPSGSTSLLSYPYGIRVTHDNLIYVIENKAARLTVMKADGTIAGRFGRPGRGLYEFYQPWDLTVLSDGRVLIADTGNHRLVELTP